MSDPKSKDATDLLAAVENAPEIFHVSGAKATQCAKPCDNAPVAITERRPVACDLDDSPVAPACDVDDAPVAPACDVDSVS